MHQLSFADVPLRQRRVLQEKPQPTSTAAFKSVKLMEEQRRVLAAIIASGECGLTADQLDHGHQRIAELRRMHLIRSNGQKRRTKLGRQAAVYVFNSLPS